ncbi:CapA family protein [Thalassobacillus hwangdonensis]|uniref:CapA family protein n=1 Tax=Thalassobacillus hwangdonensis TaxID=546108 RepID=A0ABW3L4C6_9BACI
MSQISLAATGDVLLHSRVYRLCKTKKGYEFKGKMSAAKELLSSADLSIVNLEAIVAGEEIGLSSFPTFNNPVELAQTLKDFGTDIVTNSNNHALDFGEEGALRSIQNLEAIGLDYVGSHKSKKDRSTFRVIERKGIKCALLSFSAVSLGNQPPKGKEFLLNRIKSSTKSLRLEIEKLKKEHKPDVIIVSLHFGKEYALYPGGAQQELASSVSDCGADIIIGHHPHVLQPAEWITNSRGKRTFVIYSLGNFYSGQKGLYRQIGGSLHLDIKKHSKNPGDISIEKPRLHLTYVDASKESGFQMHSFLEYIKRNPYIKTDHDVFDSIEVYSELSNRFKKWMPEIELK